MKNSIRFSRVLCFVPPLASAVLLYYSFVPEWGFLLAHVALAPLFVSILRGCGFAPVCMFGCVFAALYFSWLTVFSPLAPILMTALHGFWLCAGLWTVLRFRSADTPWKTLILAGAGWIASEWLRSFGPYGYEWGALGYSQYGSLKLAAYSSIGGVWLVSAIVLGSNAIVTVGWLKMRQDWIGIATLYWVALWVLSPSHHLSGEAPAAKSFALVQTNISPWLKSLEREAVMQQQLGDLAVEAARSPAQNVVLPETLFSTEITGMRGFLTEEPRALLMGFLAPSADRRLLVGAIEKDDRGFYNAAILFDGQGERIASYRKRHLVPFGETIPGLENADWARSLGEKLGTPFFSAGDTHAPILFGHVPVAVLVCFEGTFSRLVAESAAHARLILNISNDAWSESEFGHAQHARFLRFRAIETGLPVLRVGNSGPTALFAPNGIILYEAHRPTPAVLDLDAFRS
ncbi:MAG: apolipoprotein N-acyltransferase [Candidatus Lindowbacteria bacterium RIFCSPLOWO2_12_FULL_62_27]|nr:MAG: apolipoprotein N-acyltransferase [Candidatus Lindowbacteria bacterium RIFCSPLOWO2_12_FULL_62_27]OGH63980.1 MAG: apolipoprotein N-acyltransferase [Candidatus Lindowbacteria bacterium RIFCSPLOWO2_02_FULL_62_12]